MFGVLRRLNRRGDLDRTRGGPADAYRHWLDSG
jgi:hypothetical protein